MVASLKKFMQQISGKKAPGPSTSFSIFHVYYALELMEQQPLGRNKLAEKLCVGDGAVRTIISRLREAELIETSKSGCNLTEQGKAVRKKFEEIFPNQSDLQKSELSNAEYNHAFLVKGAAEKVGSGIDQRDAAIIAGARRALVIVYKNGQLGIHAVSDDIEKQYPKAAKQILEMQPNNNDVIIVASAETPLKAKRGAFAAAWSLVSV
jgi:predicted transcriptional regulator